MNKDVVLPGIKIIEEEAMSTDEHFLTGAAKGSLKRIAKSFEEKKKKTERKESIEEYNLITTEVNDALERVNKKHTLKKN